MGAEWFQTEARGATAKEAFTGAVERAQHERGHSGYSGTIAEKHEGFIEVTVDPSMRVAEFVKAVYNAIGDSPANSYVAKALDIADNKWGPAACVKLGEGRWGFFGFASS
jgi:hypothetical protein